MSPLGIGIKIQMWVIWFAIAAGCVMFPYFLVDVDKEIPSIGMPGVFELLMMIAPFLAAMFMRFWMLPRAKDVQAQLSAFIMGLAFGEGLVFFGIFLFPAHRFVFYILAAVAILAFIPFRIGRKRDGEEGRERYRR